MQGEEANQNINEPIRSFRRLPDLTIVRTEFCITFTLEFVQLVIYFVFIILDKDDLAELKSKCPRVATYVIFNMFFLFIDCAILAFFFIVVRYNVVLIYYVAGAIRGLKLIMINSTTMWASTYVLGGKFSELFGDRKETPRIKKVVYVMFWVRMVDVIICSSLLLCCLCFLCYARAVSDVDRTLMFERAHGNMDWIPGVTNFIESK